MPDPFSKLTKSSYMNRLHRIKRNFVRQHTEDSCGTACLAMLLYQYGRNTEAEKINREQVPRGGLSLLQLQKLAVSVGFNCRCVEMDLNHLKNLKGPVILHTLNDDGRYHFQICYGYYKKIRSAVFLVADPAFQVYYIDEAALDKQWQSRAALYFDNPDQFNQCNRDSALSKLLAHRSFPLGLLFALPVLSMVIATLGVTLTWLLQKGFTNVALFNSHIIYIVVAILFFISIARNLISYLRQYILIQINLYTNSTLMNQLFQKIMSFGLTQDGDLKTAISNSFLDVQKIQNAISAFVAIVVSDGCLLIFLIAGSIYLMWLPGLLNLIYLLLSTYLGIMILPFQLHGAQRLAALSRASETTLLNTIKEKGWNQAADKVTRGFESFYNINLKYAKQLAISASFKYMLLECLGTIELTIVIIIGIYRFRTQKIDYTSFMLLVIETYLITVMMQKIVASFQQIAEGADAAVAYSRS